MTTLGDTTSPSIASAPPRRLETSPIASPPVLPSTSTDALLSRAVVAPHTPASVILVGSDAAALHSSIIACLAEHAARFGIITPVTLQAPTFLEAILLADQQESHHAAVIIGSWSGAEFGASEPAQAETIIRTLRRVYPAATILLLSEPEEEALSMKARRWGGEKKSGNDVRPLAVDYAILPVDWSRFRRTVERALAMSGIGSLAPRASGLPAATPPAVSPADPLTLTRDGVAAERMNALSDEELAAVLSPVAPPINVPASRAGGSGIVLPLDVQTHISEALVAAREDLATELVEILQKHVPWNGALRFWPTGEGAAVPTEATSSANGLEHRAPVIVTGQPALGTLSLVLDASAPDASETLQEAARWLAAMLSLARRYEMLRSLAITDELSGAYNRRYFMKFTGGLIERARTGRFRVSLLLFDIDDFKKYNDTFGHASGDSIIRELIKLLRSSTRPHDLVARLGGDEFAVVFWDNEAPRQPNSEHPKDALSATERFRKAIHEHEWPQLCSIKGEVSISGGLATFPWDADSLEGLMERADQTLLRAKSAGKNVILLHTPGSQIMSSQEAETQASGSAHAAQ